MTRPAKPYTSRLPAKATSSTSRLWPGSKRIAVPAAIFNRNPLQLHGRTVVHHWLHKNENANLPE